MTTLTKIEVRITQFIMLCTFILVSKRWFSWPLKMPSFVLLVCGFVITRPYEWIYVWQYRRWYGKNIDAAEIAEKMMYASGTERFTDIVEVFI